MLAGVKSEKMAKPVRTQKRISKNAEAYAKDADKDVQGIVEMSYMSGADSEATRAVILLNCLEHIKKWKFSTDGRKFNGNPKLILKHIIEYATDAVFKYHHAK